MKLARNRFENKGEFFMCCKTCTERYVGCHSDCSKYIESKAQYEEAKQNYLDASTEYHQIEGYEYHKRTKYKREKKRKAMQR